jgi:Icc-related predicted phosphoesterase
VTRLRIFFASDLHGSDLCFRKFLGAARAFRADAIVLGGDLTGKALVPIVRRSSSLSSIYLDHEPLVVQDDAALDEAERSLSAAGRYTVRLEPDQLACYLRDEDYQQRLLREAAVRQVRRWVEEAERVLSPLGVECYIMAGNDDEPEIVEALDSSGFVVNHDGRIVYIREAVPLVGLGPSNLTPFNSPRELPESEIAARLDRLFQQLPDPSGAVLNAHCPPFGTGLDFAPEIGTDKEVISYGGQPRMIPVGSTAVLEAIRRYQPLVGLHGHCHDSKHRCRIGATTCVNPGSLYAEGTLAGAIIDITEGKRVSCQFVNG